MHSIEQGARLFLAGCAVLLVLAVSLHSHPFTRCHSCGGTGRNRGSTARRFGTCKRCGGSGRRQRTGSRTVHRAAWRIRGEWARSRARRAERKAAERAMHPRNLADRDH
jgi:hypothetical protein